MVRIAYHASHEQFTPRELLDFIQAAETAGFDGGMSSDHFAPWSARQGESGFVWSWMGAALQATRRMPIGMITVPMGWRYHPAIVAQGAATLAQMFPGRLPWLALGSGQALSEHIVGDRWPAKAERNARLAAAVDIIRALWRGETVSRGGPIPVDEARIYTLPERLPILLGAALTPATARAVAAWADGLITINQPLATMRELVAAFRDGGGAGKPLTVQVHLAWDETEALARRHAHEQWRSNTLPAAVAETLRLPEEFDAACARVRPDDLDAHVHIAVEPARLVEQLREYVALGADALVLHNVGRNQHAFIDMAARVLLPALRRL